MISKHCESPLVRLTSHRTQDMTKKAMWMCKGCRRIFTQRLRRKKVVR